MKKLKKILIMGLPGSGKTTLASKLAPLINAKWINADEVRKEANDWDFSLEGRLRQSNRMKKLAEEAIKEGRNVVADFVCPTTETRKDFDPDYIIWMDTIEKGRFDDTNQVFEKPNDYDFKVLKKNADFYAKEIIKKLKL